MKRIVVLLLVMSLLVLTLIGCGNESESAANGIYRDDTAKSSDDENASNEENINANDIQIDWKTTETYRFTNYDGYVFERTVTYSPFIKYSDEDMINKAWADLGLNGNIPTPNDMGYVQDGENCKLVDSKGVQKYWNNQGGYAYAFIRLTIENVTEGFSFSPSKPYTPADEMTIDLYEVANPEKGIGAANDLNDVLTMKMVGGYREMTTDMIERIYVVVIPEKYTPKQPDGNENTKDLALLISYDDGAYADGSPFYKSVAYIIGKTY